MPKIQVSDRLSAELISTQAGPGSGLSKYFRGDVAAFVASAELVQASNKPISSLSSSPMGLGLAFQTGGSFGATGAEWNLGVGSRSVVTSAQAGETIGGEDVFGQAIQVPAGKTFLGYSLSPSLSAGIEVGKGDLTFGFQAGSSFEYRAGKTFDLSGGAGPTLLEAFTAVLKHSIVPGDVADLTMMAPGDLVSLSGSGQFKLSAKFDLAAAMSPLSTPKLGLDAIGALQLKAGASLTVGASIGVSGSYQIRVAKLDAERVTLGYYKMAGSEFRFEVNASAGIEARLGDREFLTKLLSGLSTAPKAEIVDLVDVGLSDAQIASMQAAIQASIQRSLSLSLMVGFAQTATNQSVFEYEFELSRLDDTGKEALHHALDGDLAALTRVEPDELPAGIRLVRSELQTLRKKSFTWKINLLGIVNVMHFTEFIRTGKVLFEPSSGELVITDSITYKEILVKTRPLETDTQKLRKLLMQSMVLTAAYRVAGLRKFLSFESTQSYFDQVPNLRRQATSDYLDHFLALGLIAAPEKDSFLAAPSAGAGSLFLELALDDAAFRAALLNPAGQALPQASYDAIGRRSILSLILPGDENDFRRIPMQDDNLWRQMTELGQFALRAAMPAALRGDVRFAVIQHDYTVIRWWSAAMSAASAQVAAMLQFLNGADPETLRDSNLFKKQRDQLTSALAEVVKNSLPDFLDAWGLIAMDAAAGQRGKVRATLLTKSGFLVKSRP